MSTANNPQNLSTEQPPAYQGRDAHSNNNSSLEVPSMDNDARLSMEDEARPLPEGWIRQFDHNSNHHFYVDTKATPPRSIWVHPYEDPDYRKAHGMSDQEYDHDTGSKHVSAFRDRKGAHSDGEPVVGESSGSTSKNTKKEKERGFLGKIKDAAIGTKEEREAERKARVERDMAVQRAYLERRRLLLEQQAAMRQNYPNSPLFRNAGYGGGMYGPPPMAYRRQRRGGGMGLPLAGGLAGGLLLGSMLDGDGYGGGDFGGGDFGGGDFGGGDFGGGDF